MRLRGLLPVGILATCVAATFSVGVHAKTLTWSFQADLGTLDPQAMDETFTLGFLGNVYEGLIERGPNMEILPCLAERWEVVDPKRWRFYLRKGVTFQQGQPFTADDVVFSVNRSKSEGSRIKSSKMISVAGAEKVDDYTVDILLKSPNPILVADWGNWYIISKTWAEENGIKETPTIEEMQKSYAATHANGTGPFKVIKREADTVTVAVPNENWWGKKTHNLDKVEFRPIGSPATRVAALLSGEVDLAIPVPIQDQARVDAAAALQMLTGPELRTNFFGLDVSAPELESSNVKGKNPLADVRVRKAIYQAIDAQAIHRVIMRGQSTVTAAMIGPAFNGFPKHLKRYPYNLDEAKALMKEAGYADGFSMTIECPNNRYVNDEKICTAVAGMLGKIGIKAKVFAMPKSQYFTRLADPKIQNEMYYLGLSPGNVDASGLLQELVHSRSGPWGTWNAGNVADPKLDEFIEKAINEGDKAKRDAYLKSAQDIIHDQVYFIPIHQQALSWGVKKSIDLVQRPDNVFVWKYVTVK